MDSFQVCNAQAIPCTLEKYIPETEAEKVARLQGVLREGFHIQRTGVDIHVTNASGELRRTLNTFIHFCNMQQLGLYEQS